MPGASLGKSRPGPGGAVPPVSAAVPNRYATGAAIVRAWVVRNRDRVVLGRVSDLNHTGRLPLLPHRSVRSLEAPAAVPIRCPGPRPVRHDCRSVLADFPSGALLPGASSRVVNSRVIGAPLAGSGRNAVAACRVSDSEPYQSRPKQLLEYPRRCALFRASFNGHAWSPVPSGRC